MVVSLDMQASFEKYKTMVESKIKELVPSGFENFYDAMDYTLSSGGKRLRPMLCLLACEALGGKIEQAVPAAAAIEVAHNFTLVHDDIEDGDETRRGKPTVWKKVGVPHAINVGDGMLMKAYECLAASAIPAEKRIRLLERMTQTLVEVAEGQNMDINFRQRGDVTADEYITMARKKCGVLFGFSLEAGAIAAGADSQVQAALYNFGSDIGLAFMVRDDVLNLAGDARKYGKEICGDIREGKRTLITIDCLSKCATADRARLLEILKAGHGKVSDGDVAFAISLINKHGSIAYAQKRSEEMITRAMQTLKNIRNAKLKEALEEFSDTMVKRES
jgi:geranylgeranyl diphosphate synthase type I